MNIPMEAARRDPAGPTNPRVLVVEDDAIQRKILLRLLDQLGREGLAVDDAPAALQALEGGDFGLILMPLDRPGADGLAACREIRLRGSRPGRARVAILAVVEDASEHDRASIGEAGPDGHLARPITRDSLREALAALGGAGRARRPLDRAALLGRCGGDVHFMAELLASFAESVTYTLGILRDTLGSGELARAAEAAHGLKGSSRTVAADPLAESASDLERAARAGDLAGSRAALARASEDWSALLPTLGIPREATP